MTEEEFAQEFSHWSDGWMGKVCEVDIEQLENGKLKKMLKKWSTHMELESEINDYLVDLGYEAG